MQILVCIDDTDDLESKGTGQLAEEIAAKIKADGWGHTTGITRHQLFVHPDIPYTSHNSAMCFKAEIQEKYFQHVINYASQYLLEQSAPSADPGLCVANIASMRSPDSLIEFGLRAKREVITKEEAYQTAKFQGIHLSEHGGTGQGVIGALAGAGLRLSGNDGRYKGKIKLNRAPGAMTVKELLECTSIERVQSLTGDLLDPADAIDVGTEIKTVHLGHRRVLLVSPAAQDNKRWVLCSKQQLKCF
jgi:hypothetical protein